MKETKAKNKALKSAATVAKKSASFFGDLYCGWWDYQPRSQWQ